MARILQLRRGGTASNDAFTGALGELTVDTSKHELRIHDGYKKGGYGVASKQDIEDIQDAYLAKSGGSLNGSLASSQEVINCKTDGSFVRFNGGTGLGKGASILLTGKDFSTYKGAWVLYANDGTTSCNLRGFPDGTLDWDGHTVLTDKGFTLDVDAEIKMSANNGALTVRGGTTSEDGAGLWLYGGRSSYKGAFRLRASETSGVFIDLVGTSDDKLTWGGAPVLHVGNITSYIAFKIVAPGDSMTIPSGGKWTWAWWSIGPAQNRGIGNYSGGATWKNTSGYDVVGFCLKTSQS